MNTQQGKTGTTDSRSTVQKTASNSATEQPQGINQNDDAASTTVKNVDKPKEENIRVFERYQ